MKIRNTNNISFTAQATPRTLLQASLQLTTGQPKDMAAVIKFFNEIRNENNIPESRKLIDRGYYTAAEDLKKAMIKAMERQFPVLTKIQEAVKKIDRSGIIDITEDILNKLIKNFGMTESEYTVKPTDELKSEVQEILTGIDLTNRPISIIKTPIYPTSNVVNLDAFRRKK